MLQNIILWDGAAWDQLLPLTYTRPIAELRIGILTIREKYEKYTGSSVSSLTKDYLRKKYKAAITADNIVINSSVLPDEELLKALSKLNPAQALWKDDIFIGGRFKETEVDTIGESIGLSQKLDYSNEVSVMDRPWKIFQLNDKEIKKDFLLITKGRKSQAIHESNFAVKPEDIFIEEGATVLYSSLNASSGPIYIGKNAEVMEGSLIRGPFALGEHSTLKLGTKIYGATTIGPHCKIGGEVNNSVFAGYSNKAHDGFIGNAVIGEWCNIGADSNNSNLKNNYEEVKVWSIPEKTFVKTGTQFCGLFMGDHSKCGINTMLNTGTVIGVSSNIFGGGFPRTWIPSFSWGGAAGMTDYKLDKAFETATKVMERRGLELTKEDQEILTYIYNQPN